MNLESEMFKIYYSSKQFIQNLNKYNMEVLIIVWDRRPIYFVRNGA